MHTIKSRESSMLLVSTAQLSMKRAAQEVRKLSPNCIAGNDEPINTRVSVDGTWQKRGHSSMNGIVTIMSAETAKCLDTEVLSKSCKGCQVWENKKADPNYNDWKASHICSINHRTSAGAIESAGAIKNFNRSVRINNLRYLEYLGDGDTSSFRDVNNSKPYPGHEIEKLECIGHIQKRVGSRLRNLRVKWSGKKLSDGKRLTGRHRLTDKVINTLQNYYGMAIRNSQGKTVHQMRVSVGAILFHCSENKNAES